MVGTTLLFLAGGAGSRMGLDRPKQFLNVGGKPLAFYSLEAFARCEEVTSIVVVCRDEHRLLFADAELHDTPIAFVAPGAERQDSVWNALQVLPPSSSHVVTVHDAARPCPPLELLPELLRQAAALGAAGVGMPVTDTVKHCEAGGKIIETLDRKSLFAVQTPQSVLQAVLMEGLAEARRRSIHVTDDLQAAELVGVFGSLLMGSEDNIKVTCQRDLKILQALLEERSR